ncbi:MAG: GIY-YIG nuclease family protein [Ignavibacteria bacterium]|nr:GIY-YIG nuclease family protein [Ignavibacteria bacterium]
MYYTYIIHSEKLNKYYIGYSGDIAKRLEHHNAGWSHFTSQANDWILKYSEQYETKSEAMKREYDIKRKKSRKYIEQLVCAGGRPDE